MTARTGEPTRAHAVALVEDVPPGAVREVDVEGRAVVLANLDGELVALDGTCPHAGGPLGAGTLTPDGRLVCSWHRAAFVARTGAPCRGPARKPVRRHRVTVADGVVLVRVER